MSLPMTQPLCPEQLYDSTQGFDEFTRKICLAITADIKYIWSRPSAGLHGLCWSRANLGQTLIKRKRTKKLLSSSINLVFVTRFNFFCTRVGETELNNDML